MTSSRASFSALPQALALAGALAFAACQWLIYVYAPVEAQLGLMQKIFYVHLPLAWWALISFFVVFLASVAVLLRASDAADRLCRAAAEVGVLLTTLTLATGMIWARRSWGVWWTWDPRLTTALIMWFVYAGYLLLRGLDLPPRRKSVICAVVGIVLQFGHGFLGAGRSYGKKCTALYGTDGPASQAAVRTSPVKKNLQLPHAGPIVHPFRLGEPT